MTRTPILPTLKALADETRLRILNLLYIKELCVCDIIEILNIPQSKTSRHLAYLKNTNLVLSNRKLQWIYYRLNPDYKNHIEYIINNYLIYESIFKSDLTNLEKYNYIHNC